MRVTTAKLELGNNVQDGAYSRAFEVLNAPDCRFNGQYGNNGIITQTSPGRRSGLIHDLRSNWFKKPPRDIMIIGGGYYNPLERPSEPYEVAKAFFSHLPKKARGTVHVLDNDDNVLAAGGRRDGFDMPVHRNYHQGIDPSQPGSKYATKSREIYTAYLRDYLGYEPKSNKDGYPIKTPVIDRVRYHRVDIETDLPPAIEPQLILCLAVLQYLKPEAQQRALIEYLNLLPYGGMMVIAETQPMTRYQLQALGVNVWRHRDFQNIVHTIFQKKTPKGKGRLAEMASEIAKGKTLARIAVSSEAERKRLNLLKWHREFLINEGINVPLDAAIPNDDAPNIILTNYLDKYYAGTSKAIRVRIYRQMKPHVKLMIYLLHKYGSDYPENNIERIVRRTCQIYKGPCFQEIPDLDEEGVNEFVFPVESRGQDRVQS